MAVEMSKIKRLRRRTDRKRDIIGIIPRKRTCTGTVSLCVGVRSMKCDCNSSSAPNSDLQAQAKAEQKNKEQKQMVNYIKDNRIQAHSFAPNAGTPAFLHVFGATANMHIASSLLCA